ncbi:MAG: 2-oxo acid dehydrogenase subunit E2 [Bacteroidales bacterium]|nr:2-oxo acid dehydrogenase subunit E2 [Bacteroidales bacterium]
MLKKPVILDNKLRIREILNITILLDHDVMDGAPMVRFLDYLTDHLGTGKEINNANA